MTRQHEESVDGEPQDNRPQVPDMERAMARELATTGVIGHAHYCWMVLIFDTGGKGDDKFRVNYFRDDCTPVQIEEHVQNEMERLDPRKSELTIAGMVKMHQGTSYEDARAMRDTLWTIAGYRRHEPEAAEDEPIELEGSWFGG